MPRRLRTRRKSPAKALAYIYAREKQANADIAHMLTLDEAQRIAMDVAKRPELLGPQHLDAARRQD